MGLRGRLISFALVACVAAACKRSPPPEVNDAAPPDRLADGEAVEGTERAFGLPLPRRSTVKAIFGKTVHVESTLTPEELANYVRARVTDGHVAAGSSSTAMTDVAPTAEPTRRLRIDIRAAQATDRAKSEMVVRDATPPPVEPGLSDEERWNKAGLTPSGRLLEPQRLE